MVRVIFSENYQKAVSKIKDSLTRERSGKMLFKIRENPEIGKPMRYARKGTREIYAGSFRLSYLYDKNSGTIFILDFYHKDEQ